MIVCEARIVEIGRRIGLEVEEERSNGRDNMTHEHRKRRVKSELRIIRRDRREREHEKELDV